LIGGTYPLRSKDSDTTVTELNAIASPPHSGWKYIPKRGVSMPAAAGTRSML